MRRSAIALVLLFVSLVHPAAEGQQESGGRAAEAVREYEALRASAQECKADDTGMTIKEMFDAGLFSAGCYTLWIGCGNVTRHVAVVPNENTIGVQQFVIENAIAARLRAAGVYEDATVDFTDAAQSNLVVIVQLYGGRYDIRFDFHKHGGTRDVYGFWQKSNTWERERRGTHGGQGSVVMEEVRVVLDEFMNEFLWVNEPACSRR